MFKPWRSGPWLADGSAEGFKLVVRRSGRRLGCSKVGHLAGGTGLTDAVRQ
ncbi:MAG: hypothetical protein RL514_4751 [Verrucomicrobiota bacterium]|jgi:hypothetical protein